MKADDIELKIDKAFIETFLAPRQKVVTDFLINFLSSEFQFRDNTKKINVISLFMYAPCPLSFLFIEPNCQYYSSDDTVNRPELKLDEYTYVDIDELCIKILNKNNIDYSAHLDKFGELNSEIFWENRYKLEHEFIINCWRIAKEKTQSQIFGFLEFSDGAGGIYDLDTGFCISDENLEADNYLEGKNIFFEKEI